MGLANTIPFLLNHPLSRGRRAETLSRFALWQLRSRTIGGAVPFEFVNGSKLLAAPGLTGATGNLYVGLHEFEEMAFALHFLRPGDLFADVGANVGSYTILAAAGIGSRVSAFEPGVEAFGWLTRNIALNCVENLVNAHQMALGASRGTARFTDSLDTTNRVDANGTKTITMETLDGALAGDCPSLLKIDVEGYEPEVLAGAARTLDNRTLQAVIMEMNHPGCEAPLIARGFERVSYDPTARALLPAAQSANGLFVRPRELVETKLKDATRFSVRGWHI
jgi:FkbM family methyltransferase